MWQISLFQRSKANHNTFVNRCVSLFVVANIIISKIESKSQPVSNLITNLACCGKYHYFKDRKQITTKFLWLHRNIMLWQISLFQRSKANHNSHAEETESIPVVANIIISKIESKSQRLDRYGWPVQSCGKYHYFKDRKQITTVPLLSTVRPVLWQISLFQRSKANHNTAPWQGLAFVLWQISLFQRSKANHNQFKSALDGCYVVANIIISKIESKSQLSWGSGWYCLVVANIIISKIESKSQLFFFWLPRPWVVANIIISKIESKSQLTPNLGFGSTGCGKYHYFKDRKQITTLGVNSWGQALLWQISLFQRSKANHNWLLYFCGHILLWQISLFQRSKANHNKFLTKYASNSVVANIIISKIESKSQQHHHQLPHSTSCGKYHYFKDRKQITTSGSTGPRSNKLWQISLFQRSKANHNPLSLKRTTTIVVANIIISKIESKSQLTIVYILIVMSCGKYHYFKDRKQITTSLIQGK